MANPRGNDYERAILGVVLVNGDCMALVASLLAPHHFGLDSHQRIYNAMLRLFAGRQAITDLTLADALGGVDNVQAIGGIGYITDLSQGMHRFTEDMIRDYAGRIRQAWKARQVVAEAVALEQKAEDGEDIDAVIAETQARLEAIACDSGEQSATADGCADAVLEAWEREHGLIGSPAIGFGIDSLDEAVGGMFPGHQVVVGARSSVGKTRFMLQSAASVCARGERVQLNLIEPTKDEVLRGLACFAAGLRASVASEPWTATREERDRFRGALAMVRKWPLEIYDNAGMTLDQVIARGRAAIHKGCRMIGLDYLQRLEVPMRDKNEQVRLRVARASTALANLVKDTPCTSLVLSQLRRTETMGIPSMQDLRESGQIENDAHLIVLLHRDYDAERGIFTAKGSYVVPKRRFGSPTNKRAVFNPVSATWEDGEPQPVTARWHERAYV